MRRPAKTPIDISAMTRKIDADNRIPLRNYYRIADNLLKQANIYRAEKNIIDLYIILLRYSSLVSETIPYHRDYQALYPKERSYFKKMLLKVIDELEALKPEFRRRLDEMDRVSDTGQVNQSDGLERIRGGSATSTSERPAINYTTSLNFDSERLPGNKQTLSPWKQKNGYDHISSSNSMDMQLQKLSIGLPLPKQETLSRHSFLGPNGLRSQFVAPTSEIKVNYPASADFSRDEIVSLNQVGQDDHLIKGGIKVDNSTMESVLSLDDGRWSRPAEKLDPQFHSVPSNGGFSYDIIRQPLPPPVLAQVQPEYLPISPSKVADPRPGPANTFKDGMSGSNSYQHLHIPVKMMDNFLRLAQENTARNLETCGVLAGSLRNRVFHITTLIIPKQESTSDSCQTLNEEEIFDVQDKNSLFPLGWIHTHPSQTCFMSSVDLHTHYSYQIMLPEAVAIVMAPKDESSPHGIFHLSDPGGVAVIRNCQQRGFHPHEEPEDGSPLYEHCSHVYMNANLKFEVIDLR